MPFNDAPALWHEIPICCTKKFFQKKKTSSKATGRVGETASGYQF
jgi:hypothetical protein